MRRSPDAGDYWLSHESPTEKERGDTADGDAVDELRTHGVNVNCMLRSMVDTPQPRRDAGRRVSRRTARSPTVGGRPVELPSFTILHASSTFSTVGRQRGGAPRYTIDTTVLAEEGKLPMSGKTMTQRAPRWHLAPILALALGASAWALESVDEARVEAARAAVEERLTQVRERLALTDEQMEKTEPIVRKGLEAQGELLAERGFARDGQHRRGGDRPSLREMRRLGREMDAIRESTLKQLGEVLDEKQVEEYAAMQKERKAELRQRIRRRR